MINVSTVKTQIMPETAVWRGRVIANGGGLVWNSVFIANNLIRALRGKSYFNKIKHLIPMLGTGINAACIPLIDVLNVGAATNVSFVDSDFSQSTGLQGNGTTKYLDSLVKASQIGISGNGGIGVSISQFGTGGWTIGSYDPGASEIYGMQLFSNETCYWGTGAGAFSTGVGGSATSYYLQRFSGTDRKLYKNAVVVGNSSVGSVPITGIATNTIKIMGIDSSFLCDHRLGFPYMTDGTMSSDEISSLTTLLQAYLTGPTGRS